MITERLRTAINNSIRAPVLAMNSHGWLPSVLAQRQVVWSAIPNFSDPGNAFVKDPVLVYPLLNSEYRASP